MKKCCSYEGQRFKGGEHLGPIGAKKLSFEVQPFSLISKAGYGI